MTYKKSFLRIETMIYTYLFNYTECASYLSILDIVLDGLSKGGDISYIIYYTYLPYLPWLDLMSFIVSLIVSKLLSC